MQVTTKDLTDWVEKHASTRLSDNNTPLQAVCWFVSVYEARFFHEDTKLRETAELIRDGRPIAGPYQTEEHVQGWLDTWIDCSDSGEWNEAEWERLTEDMKQHFQV